MTRHVAITKEKTDRQRMSIVKMRLPSSQYHSVKPLARSLPEDQSPPFDCAALFDKLGTGTTSPNGGAVPTTVFQLVRIALQLENRG